MYIHQSNKKCMVVKQRMLHIHHLKERKQIYICTLMHTSISLHYITLTLVTYLALVLKAVFTNAISLIVSFLHEARIY